MSGRRGRREGSFRWLLGTIKPWSYFKWKDKLIDEKGFGESEGLPKDKSLRLFEGRSSVTDGQRRMCHWRTQCLTQKTLELGKALEKKIFRLSILVRFV